jgi:hypothetical protein
MNQVSDVGLAGSPPRIQGVLATENIVETLITKILMKV